MSATQIVKPKRSIKLSHEEIAEFYKRIEGITKPLEQTYKLGLSREVIENIKLKGTCSERTYHILFPGKPVS